MEKHIIFVLVFFPGGEICYILSAIDLSKFCHMYFTSALVVIT